MTQEKSSFTSWLIDFLRRCFGREYIKESEDGTKHNFRKCRGCGTFVLELSLREGEHRCRRCNDILLQVPYSITGEKPKLSLLGIFYWGRGKSRQTVGLSKPLYDIRISWSVLLTVASIIFLALTYRPVNIPKGFYNTLLDTAVWFFIMLNFWFLTIAWLRKIVPDPFVFPVSLDLLILLLWTIPLVLLNQFAVVPIWREVPTEIEYREQQRLQVQKTLDSMESSIERFEVAVENKEINARPYFIEAAKVDFVVLMQKYSDFVQELDPYYGTKFYVLVQEYLESLDSDILNRQCCDDPWNIIYTPMSIARFSENIKMCSEFMP